MFLIPPHPSTADVLLPILGITNATAEMAIPLCPQEEVVC